MGFEPVLIGRKLPDSKPIINRPYRTKRFKLPFEKGPLFYAFYNLRLFIYLLFKRSNLLIANDLDTLAANYLIHKLKKTPLVYDSHEYFTGVPELISRPRTQKIWLMIEKAIFPKLQDVITVNDSIAELYMNEYGIRPKVVRNIPLSIEKVVTQDRASLKLPEHRSIIILQGAGINIDRGAEEAVLAMQYLENALLLIIGGGDVIEILKGMVVSLKLEEKVWLIPKQPMNILENYTKCADIGLTLDKDTSINYKFSLPNKLFDYIQAEIPVLASDLPEVKKIVEKYKIGLIAKNHDPLHLADCMQIMLVDKNRRAIWKENLKIAARELCWENEEKVLRDIYAKYI
jgi:glycosyltransferase involved in cell wall biosynthesis